MAIKKWRMLERKELLKHPRLNVSEDLVQLPNGKTLLYIHQNPPKGDSVGIIAINDKNEILLQREYSYPIDEVMWQLPGGKVEENESVVVAANRELSEESGYKAKTCKTIGSFYTANRHSAQKQYIVVCTELTEQKLENDPEEFIESTWHSFKDVRQKIRSGEIQNISMLAALQLWEQSK